MHNRAAGLLLEGGNASSVEWTAPYPEWATALLWLLMTVLALETIAGNLLVLVSFFVDRSLRSGSNYLIASLAVSDLIIGVEGFPVLTYYIGNGQKWVLARWLCDLWLSVDYILCLVSILTVLLITLDRYCSVCHTIRYRQWQSIAKVRVMILLSWIIPTILFSMTIFGWETFTGEKPEKGGACSAPFLSDPYLNMSMYLVYYWATLVAMIVLYCGIHKVAHSLQERGEAKEKQAQAMAALQRCMAQMGVSVMAAAHNQQNKDRQTEVSVQSSIPPVNDTVPIRQDMTLDSGYSTSAHGAMSVQSNLGAPTARSSCSHNTLCLADVLKPCSVNEKEELTSVDNQDDNVDDTSLVQITPNSYSCGSTVSAYSSCKHPECDVAKSYNLESPYFSFHQTVMSRLFGHESLSKRESDGTFTTAVSHMSKSSYSSCHTANTSNSSTKWGGSSRVSDTSVRQWSRTMSTASPTDTHLSAQSSIRLLSNQSSLSYIQNVDHQRPQSDLAWPFSRSPSFHFDESALANHLKRTTEQSLSKPNGQDITVGGGECRRIDVCSPMSEPPLPRPKPYPHFITPSLPNRNQVKPAFARNFSCRNRKENALSSTLKRFRSGSIASVPVDKDTYIYQISAEEDSSSSTSTTPEKPAPPPPKLQDTVHDNPLSSNYVESSISVEITSTPRLSKFASLFNPSFLKHRRRKRTRAEKRARKAFRTITIILGAFVLFWSPYFVFATLYGFCPNCVPDAVFMTSYYMCYLNSSLNPFCYALANRQFRAVFIRILKGDFSQPKGRPLVGGRTQSFI